MIILIIAGGLLLLLGGIVLSLNLYINEYGLEEKLRPAVLRNIQRVLYIVAHPDDEVMIAGTLAKFHHLGIETHALYLTHGEDGPTGGLTEQEDLGRFRMVELNEVKTILKLTGMEVFDFPDRYLSGEDQNNLREAVRQTITRVSPQIIISFDSLIGLYGSEDHKTAGALAREAAFDRSSGIEQFWQMTLSKPMKNLAMKLSKTFRERFDGTKDLPAANLGIGIATFSGEKMKVVRAHKTQWQVMREMQPLHHVIPAFIYYRIFSREYFAIERSS